MDLKIFDVAHGACALLTADDGQKLMIDCGHNSDTGWKPGSYLRSQGIDHIEMLAITNYDEDHVSGLPNLLDNVTIGRLWRNSTVTPQVLKNMKSEYGMGHGIQALVKMMEKYTKYGSPQLPFPNIQYKCFFNLYPSFTDTNNLSAVFYITINGINFVFSGDLESKGWELLLQDEIFSTAIKDTHVFVAPHHGRENGIHPEIFSIHGCTPYYVVISDKRHMHDTQKTLDFYSAKTIGGPFRDQEKRHVLTTRNDGAITFKFFNGKFLPM